MKNFCWLGLIFLSKNTNLVWGAADLGIFSGQADIGSAVKCNNDHGLLLDGRLLAVSDQSGGDNKSRIHLLPADGGPARQITPLAPSYWHGWSRDSQNAALVSYQLVYP
jgi:hypothetical protein